MSKYIPLMPPSSNTGAQTALKHEPIDTINPLVKPHKAICIDYFTCTLKVHKLQEIINFFNQEINTVSYYKFGKYGYNKHIVIGSKIKVYYDHSVNKDIMIDLSGRGCREIYKFHDWQKLFKFIRKYERYDHNGEYIRNYNISRIDLATDFYNLRYNLINKMRDSITKGLVSSKFKIATNYYNQSLTDGTLVSNSVRFGSMKSRISIIFYDKLMERKHAKYLVHDNIKSWYRMEVNYINERALILFDMLTLQEYEKISIYNSSVIYNYIDIKANLNYNDKYKNVTAKWWIDLIESTKKLRISSYNINSSLMQKMEWVDYSISKLLLKIFYAKGNNSINETLKTGLNKFTINDLNEINQYLIEQGKEPIKDFTELKNYIKFLEYMEY